ncbi:VWA domain-containing protein [Pseudomonas sp. Marseille-QA0892]
MTLLWTHWARPLWLLLIPLLALLLLWLWRRSRTTGRWHTLLPEAFHGVLLTGQSRRGSRKPWIVLGVAWLLATLALAGPSWQHFEQPMLKRADPLVVILDTSQDMLADDLSPSRMEHAKRKLLDLLEARHDAQTGIVVYAGSAHTLVPLSDDTATTRNLLGAVTPAIMPEPGHRADLAVARALALLDQGAQGRGRLVLLTSALNDEERAGIVQVLRGRSNPFNILGFGTAQGAPIAIADGGFVRDPNGAIHVPRLDALNLQSFAAEVHGRYMTAEVSDSDLRSLDLLTVAGDARHQAEVRRFALWVDQGHWLLLPLLLVACVAGRRGWILVLPLLAWIPQPAYAFEWRDLWLRPDQQGERLLEADRPGDAAERFRNPQWRAFAQYQAGDYDAAAEAFGHGQSATDRYNLGNALALAGKLEAAIDAYDQALKLDPSLEQAETNRKLVEDVLRAREPAEESSTEGDAPQPAEADDDIASEQTTPNEVEASPGTEGGAEQGEQSDELMPQTPNQEAPQTRQDTELSDAEGSNQRGERQQALELWLRQIPDDPSELLRRKFWYEQQQRQDATP